jgi:hypothetical protein
MDFKPISAGRYETHVDVVPSSPDGYFRIGDDPFYPPYAVSSIALRGIKPRHVRALRNGDTSVMDRYIVKKAQKPGYVSFTKCEPGVPDPLQPVGTSVYVREAQEVHLDRAGQIDDAHRAIGEWWAQRLLHPVMDNGEGDVVRPDVPDHIRSELERKAGDFALILADLSRSDNPRRISVDYQPDHILRDAADMAFVPAPVSIKSYTEINSDGVVMAREGRSGEVTQIWPPLPEATAEFNYN